MSLGTKERHEQTGTRGALGLIPVHPDHVQIYGHRVEVASEEQLERFLLGCGERCLELRTVSVSTLGEATTTLPGNLIEYAG